MKFPLKSLFSFSTCVLVRKFSAFLLLPLVASSLTVHEFGVANEILNLSNIYILLLCFGLDESISKKTFSGTEGIKGSILSNGLLLLFFHSVLFFVVSIYFSLFPQADDVLSKSVYIACVMFIVNSSLVNTYLKYCRIMGKDKEFIGISLISTIVQFFCVYIVVVVLNMGVVYYLISMFTVSLLSSFYILYRVGREFKFSAINTNIIISIYSYCIKVAPHMILGWGLLGFTIYSIGLHLDSYDTATFVSHNYLSVIVMTLSIAFFYTYQPWLYKALKSNEERSLIIKKIFQFVLVGFFVLLTTIILSEFIFGIIFDSRYKFNFELSTTLLFGAFFQFSASLLTYFFYYYEDQSKYISYSTIIGVLFNVVGLYLFLPVYGLLSASWVYMLSQLVVLIFRLIMFVRCTVIGSFFSYER